jgi:hypothetical protein
MVWRDLRPVVLPDKFILMPGREVPPATPEKNICAFSPCDGCLIGEELKR